MSRTRSTAAEVAPVERDRPLAPWLRQQAVALLQQRGHAWLLQGPTGLGQYDLGLALVQAWLCDHPQPDGIACGQCESCHAIAVRTHPDLQVLMPETDMLAYAWPLDEKAQKELDDKKRKPSKDIRVEAMRDAIEFAQRTSSRARGKAVLIYPAERMNHVTANALLKTLEEPVGNVRFVLATEAAHLLLPTIRSRCMTHTLDWPRQAEAQVWLKEQGLSEEDAQVLLRAAGGRAADAHELARSGVRAADWRKLPQAACQAHVQAFAGFAPAQAIDVLQKICHDALAVKAGAAPRFFASEDFPAAGRLAGWRAISQWGKRLAQDRRSAEHPYNPGLFLEDLVAQAGRALLAPSTGAGQRPRMGR
ncbi:DNA polymerase III subunit delta' [Brachymonas denitrificans]|uniref:DNA polymerase III subunit delta' n=1 Tax=Brachymonas denitrificans TaxID=28220 RepID=UPI001BCDD7FC|nr:DNA polymerase III subunit delta' [Brachymonas denitrificans]